MSLILSTDSGGLLELQKRLKNSEGILQGAANSALASTGFFISSTYKNFMRSEGEGTWPDIHGFSSKFRKPGRFGSSKGVPLISENREKSSLSKIGSFMKYIIQDGQLKTGFSFNINRFDPNLEAIVDRLVAGYDIALTDDMKKLFAFYGFPLKKETKVLKVPERPLDIATATVQNKLFRVFQDKFFFALQRRSKRLGIFLGAS